MVSIGDRLREERERLGYNQAELSAFAGQSRKSQMRYESGERSPDGDYLAAIANRGIDVLYVLTGQRTDDAGTDDAELALPSTVDYADLEAVPFYSAELAAGAGAENSADEIIEHVAFRRRWLRQIGVPSGRGVLARVDGESMQPTIWDQDLVLINRADREVPVRSDIGPLGRLPVFALLEDGAAKVKRLARPEAEQLMLVSDNPEFSPQFAKIETVTIIGKVVWWEHTSRE